MTSTIHNSANTDRAADILATVKRCGAATIGDIALDLTLHRETVRKRLAKLVKAGHLVLIEAAATHSRALYGMPDLDDQAEFDLYRTRSSNWRHCRLRWQRRRPQGRQAACSRELHPP